MVYMVMTGGTGNWECDQIVETLAIAQREKRDLEKMGCEVKIKSFVNAQAAEAWEAQRRG